VKANIAFMKADLGILITTSRLKKHFSMSCLSSISNL